MPRRIPPAGPADAGDTLTLTLTLRIPGLLAADWPPQLQPASMLDGLDLSCLQRLLTRADRLETPQADPEAMLPMALDADFPVAALSLFGDSGYGDTGYGDSGGARPEGYWLRADPVHIRTGQHRLTMAGGRDLAIRSEEAEALCAAINAHFAGDGLTLIAPTPHRWYFRWPQPPEIRFSPLPDIIGDDLYAHMPGGEAGRYWRSLLNEIQMLMYAHPVNETRREVGAPEISGLWIWGGGVLSAQGETGYTGIWSDDPLVRGLALNAGRTPVALPPDAEHWLDAAQPGRHLVFLDRLQGHLPCGDIEAWRSQLQALQQHWLVPLRAALQQDRLERLIISPASAVGYHVTRRKLRRWWRRDRPLTAFD